jgi:hypothetical protein
MQMSRRCFAEMLIHFRYGKFLALRICIIFSKVNVMITMSGRVVTRYLDYARHYMPRNK